MTQNEWKNRLVVELLCRTLAVVDKRTETEMAEDKLEVVDMSMDRGPSAWSCPP